MNLQLNQSVDTYAGMESKDYAKIIFNRFNELDYADDPRKLRKSLADHLGLHESQLSRMVRGRGGWTVERYVAALKYLDIDPHTVFCPRSKNTPLHGGDETTALILSILNKLGAPETVLSLLRMIKEVHEQRGDIEIILDAVRAVHKAAVPEKKLSAVPTKKSSR